MAVSILSTLLKRGSTTAEQRAEASNRGAQYFQKDLPDYAELVRQNVVWTGGQATATAAVAAASYPTTACQLALGNGEQEGTGKSYIILAVTGVQIGNGAALNSWGIVYGVSQAKPTTAIAADIAVASIRPLRGNGGAYGGKANIDTGPTLDVDPLYKPLGPFAGATVASLGGTQVFIPVDGLIILPPSSLLALHVVASATGITTRLQFIWAEVYLELP